MLTLLLLIACTGTPNDTDTPLPTSRYPERYRPQVHLSPASGWLNDPNGLTRLNGRWHAFYQHYPDAPEWGPMHWGHAVSDDLVHWEHLPVALAPDPVLGQAFSGSALVEDGRIAALLTHDGGESGTQKQSLAWSDGGELTVDPASPVLTSEEHTDFRDPKVLRWGGGYRMLLAAGDRVLVYAADDLAGPWTEVSTFTDEITGTWECPELLTLGEHHVLVVSTNPGGPTGGSGSWYWVGDFDGATFVPQQEARPVDHGADFYAAQAWSETETPVWTAWMSSWRYALRLPTDPWRGALTLPRTLGLVEDDAGWTLTQTPVDLSGLAHRRLQVADVALDPSLVQDLDVGVYELRMVVEPGDAADLTLGLRVGGDEITTLTLDLTAGQLILDRSASGEVDWDASTAEPHSAPIRVRDGVIDLDVVVDQGSVEAFADGYRVSLTEQIFPHPDSTGVTLTATGDVWVRTLTVDELETIWPE